MSIGSTGMSIAAAMPSSRRPRLGPALGLLGAALTVAVLIALSTGSIALPLDRVLLHLAQAIGLPGEPLGARDAAVLYTLRLPRIVLAAAVGVTLGVAGASLQAIFRNPLADPGLVGVSSGAAFAGSVTMMLGVAGLGLSRSGLSLSTLLPATAFLGALVATILILALARRDGRCSATDMLLAGIAVNALGAAGIGLCSYLGDDQALRQMTFWMMGGFGGAAWTHIGPALVLMLAATAGLLANARRLDLYALGERDAFLLGLEPHRFAVRTVLLVALGVGAAVAVSGLIGFVGLVVPHMIRLWLGPVHRRLLPATALAAATLLVLADTTARSIAAPADVPVGLLLGAVGAPVFLWLLRARGGRSFG
ncbi:FecCD family ABC transporter permease [Azospirillum lipoferum]|uniref:Hemin ABC transporter, permease component n=1 Tax=Azospirillum lipoferum (strain 4B) TaxID=862719 RepID=G7ZD11_AZOL4|nr:iron ABC transporter permease [Azospirillum lipoferum]CBS89788.1 hemin ABC transporter, permease component [Azospirillum lipoferum 4B]